MVPLPETTAIALDERLLVDPQAALERFELAEALGDDRALALPDPLPDTLPWSVRDRAHLVLARAAVERGDDEGARAHLALVFPDSTAWTGSRLLLGDLERRAGHPREAALAYKAAVRKQDFGQALLGFAAVYADLGRWPTVVHTLQMVPRDDPAWVWTLEPLARALLAQGSVGEALGHLLVLEQAPYADSVWAPEAALLRAAGEGGSTLRARRELEAHVAALDALDLGVDPWEAWFSGRASALPTAWSVSFLRRPDVAPLVERMGRIDRELALPGAHEGLEARRDATVRELGETLRRALDDERERLHALATGPDPLVGDERFDPGPAPLVWWPYNGELWADEIVVVGR